MRGFSIKKWRFEANRGRCPVAAMRSPHPGPRPRGEGECSTDSWLLEVVDGGTAAGCQPAIPPINNRRHGVGGFRLLPANSMNYQIPSLRVKGLSRESGRREAAAVQPVRAPEEVAAGRRAICEGCEHRAGEGAAARCRLFGCCHKDLSQTVKLAFQQCPAGRWPRRVPNTLIL